MGDIYTNPPQSRNEAILRATIDGIEYTDPPQSRIEDLLLELKEAIEEGGGTGEGDMKRSVYDPDRTVAQAGGIEAYVTDGLQGVEQEIVDTVGWNGKNLLDVDVESATDHGVTFTVNADKTITANGTATGQNALFTVSTKVLEAFMDADTDYYVSGLPEGASESTYCFFLNRNPNIVVAENNTVIRRDDVANRLIRISVFAGQTVNNLVFKPMVRKSLAMSDVFAPYHASVEDSLEEKADNSVIAPIENGTNASQTYAVGSHAIRNGAFITWKNAKAQNETINDESDYISGMVGDYINYTIPRETAAIGASSTKQIAIPEISGYKPFIVTPLIYGTYASRARVTVTMGVNSMVPNNINYSNSDTESRTWDISANIIYIKS